MEMALCRMVRRVIFSLFDLRTSKYMMWAGFPFTNIGMIVMPLIISFSLIILSSTIFDFNQKSRRLPYCVVMDEVFYDFFQD